jgi:hypothetical protein
VTRHGTLHVPELICLGRGGNPTVQTIVPSDQLGLLRTYAVATFCTIQVICLLQGKHRLS